MNGAYQGRRRCRPPADEQHGRTSSPPPVCCTEPACDALSYAQDLARRTQGDAQELLPLEVEQRYRYNQDFRSVFAITPGTIMIFMIMFPAMLTAIDPGFPTMHYVQLAQSVLYRAAGLDLVRPQLAVLGLLGTMFLAAALARFRTMLAQVH